MNYLKFLLISLLFLVGCEINHNPEGIIKEIEPLEYNYHKEDNQCQYYVVFISYQFDEIDHAVSSDVWYVFPCDKYDVGDTLRVQ